MTQAERQKRWGANLVKIREAQGIPNRYALARRAGVDPSYLRRIENGTVNAGDETRVKLAEVLGVTVEAIWSYAEGE